MCFQLCVDLLYSQVCSSLVTVSIEGKRGSFLLGKEASKGLFCCSHGAPPMEVAKHSSLVFLCRSDSEDCVVLIKGKSASWSSGKWYTSVAIVMNLSKMSQNISHFKKNICQINGITLLGFMSILAAKLYHTKNPSVLKYLRILVLAEAYLGKMLINLWKGHFLVLSIICLLQIIPAIPFCGSCPCWISITESRSAQKWSNNSKPH